MFDLGAAARADVLFEANVAGFRADVTQIRAEAGRTYGALSADTLKAALASDKYDRALARSKGETFAVKKATATYRQEMAALDTTTRRTSGALAAEERNFSRLARGAIFGAGALGGLRRAAVFASSSFLGGFGLTYAIRTFIKAAQEEGVALARVELALTNTGHSSESYKGRVDAALTSLVRFSAFNRDELANALAANITRFGDYETAVRATADAADVARQKGEDLATAQQQIQRASFGNPRALKQLGIELPKTTANMDALKASTRNATDEQIRNAKAADLQANETLALAAVEARYHGSAAKFLTTSAGKQALFNAELHQTEAIIGEALLPTLNRYLARGAKWLDQMNSSGRLQRDVNEVVKDAGVVFHLLGKAVHEVDHLTGGFKSTLKLLIALKLASVFLGWERGIRNYGRATVVAEAETSLLVGRVGAYTGAAKVAAGETAALSGRLGALAALGTIDVPIVISIALAAGGAELLGRLEHWAANGLRGLPSGTRPNQGNRPVSTDDPATWSDDEKAAYASQHGPNDDVHTADWYRHHPAAEMRVIKQALAQEKAGPINTRAPFRSSGGAGAKPPKPRPPVVGLNYRQQNELLIAQSTKGTGDDLRVLNRDLGVLNRALAQKGLTPAQRNQLLSARNDVLGQIDAINSAAATAHKSADAAKAAASKRAHDATVKARKKRIDTLTQAPVELRIAEKTAEAHSASEQKIVAILKREKKAIEQQIVELRHIHAGKEAIARARANEAAIQKRIDGLGKKKTTDADTQIREFLSEFQANQAAFASNVGPGKLVKVENHQHFPHPPTQDRHREGIYLRHAMEAAFD